MEYMCVGVFCTDKNRVVMIARSIYEMVLRTTKHTMIYAGLDSSFKVIAIHAAV
jgi:acid stress-induced BolA-like protein IbaG/YrbA